MTTVQWIYLGVIFAVVFGVSLVVMLQLAPNRTRARLEGVEKPETQLEPPGAPVWVARFVQMSAPLAKLSVPREGWEGSPLRRRFMHAGFRGTGAVPIFFGMKSILVLAFPAVMFLWVGVTGTYIPTQLYLLIMLSVAAIGYYLPNVVLARRIDARQNEIFENFPDAIDLMLVCVEAGLGLDAALKKVSEEISIKSRLLADELHIVTLELRAGNSKEKALHNLAMRTGVQEVETLVAMLIQADRFGTSIADSLRIHADELRTKRRLRAEEKAAKIALKLLFPLIFFIFPSMLVILLGPAFIHVYRVLLPTMSGGN